LTPRCSNNRYDLAKCEACEDRHKSWLDACQVRKQPPEESADAATEEHLITPGIKPCHLENLRACTTLKFNGSINPKRLIGPLERGVGPDFTRHR
jgi:hypothetical protein